MKKSAAILVMALSFGPVILMYSNCGGSFSATSLDSNSLQGADGSSGAAGGGASGGGSSGLGNDGTGSGTTTLAAPFTPSKIVTVCPTGCDFNKPSLAISGAQDMEQVQIMAGDYVDCVSITAANIWIQGVGGRPHIHDKTCASKGIFVTASSNANTTVDNIEFSGASISASDGNNGAGIRAEGTNLTVRNSYFHDNQNGILTDAGTGFVSIQHSHFARNGVDGFEHDMYIGHIAGFSLTNSVMEQVLEGNVVKTRANKSVIGCNVIMNGYDTGYPKAGYLIDMPNGGEEHILNNVIAQGPQNTGQHTLIAFAAEGLSNPVGSLEMSGNVVINDLGVGTIVNFFAAPTSASTLSGNKLVGGGTVMGGQSSMVTESNDTAYASRTAAGIGASQFPLPAACTSAAGTF